MQGGFKDWLVSEGIGANSLNSYLSYARAMELVYGDLDDLFDDDQFTALLSDLVYSADDERHGRPNPSKVQINSHLYKTLASHRTILRRYAQFRDADLTEDDFATSDQVEVETPQTFGLEKDMQTALRRNIAQLEPGLEVTDGGAERHVSSGFIDILARDPQGRTVVIELKAITAPLKAQAQIAAYMGDITAKEGVVPRGILVAPDFDAKLVSAARVTPTLSLTRHHYAFTFEPVT